MRASVVVPPELAGERLDKALAALVDEMSRGLARKTIGMGAVYIGRQRVRAASREVRVGDRLTATWHPKVTGEPAAHFELVEVYSDGDIVVVDKPAGQLVAGTELGDVGSLQYQLSKRYGRDTRLMHRLDKPASGLLVAARTKAASKVLTPQFREHTIVRAYLAVAAGSVTPGRMERPLKKQGRRMRLAEAGEGDTLSARTELSVLESGEGWSLVQAQLFTGRTHQIRLHATAAGAPLFGDRMYGGPSGARLALHATVLGFTSVGGTERLFRRLPGDDFWQVAGLEPREPELADLHR